MNGLIFLLFISIINTVIDNYTTFTYSDEIITLCLFSYFMYKIIHSKRCKLLPEEKNMLLACIIFYLIGALSTIIFNYQNNVFLGLLSGLFSLKAFLAYFGMRELCDDRLRSNRKKIWKLTRLLKIIMYISAVLLFIDMLYPIFTQTGIRYGISTTQFIFSHPTELCSFSVCMFLLYVFLRRDYLGKKVSPGIYISTIFMVLRGGRVKAIGFVVLIILVTFLIPFIKKFKLRYIFYAIPPVVFVAWNQIIFYFSDLNGSSRGLLYLNGFRIMRDHFPLGAGFATFGTEFSRKFYSPLYYTYNMSDVYGFVQGNALFATDTMWAPIMAEAGIVGVISMVMLFKNMFAMVNKQKFSKRTNSTLLLLIIYSLFESVGDSIFMAQRGVMIFVIFAFIFTLSLKKKQEENNDERNNY